MAENLDFYLDAFGSDLILESGTVRAVFAISNNPFLEAENRRITATGLATDLSTIGHGETVTVGGVDYGVTEIEIKPPDGQFITLVLEEA